MSPQRPSRPIALLATTSVTVAITFVLGFGTASHVSAQGFASGQTLEAGTPRFGVPTYDNETAADRQAKAEEARDKWAEGRRLAERDYEAKAKELADIEKAKADMERNAEALNEAARDSAQELIKGRAKDSMGSTSKQLKAAAGGFTDFGKAEDGAYSWLDGALAIADPTKEANLRRDLKKLAENIQLYNQQVARWNAKVAEALEEQAAEDEFNQAQDLVRVRAFQNARAQDNARARSQQNAPKTANPAGEPSSTRTAEPHDPPRSGGENARDHSSPKGEVSYGEHEGRSHKDSTDHTWK